MVKLGIGITAAIVASLVLGYFRVRRSPTELSRARVAGFLVALAGAEWLLFRHVEPVATYFTPIAWSAYILIADAATFAITGRSRLNDAPLSLARMALLSIPLWLIFEAYNLRLENWEYVGVPWPWAAAMLGYGWSFATITPAIFETSDLVQALLPPLTGEAWKISRGAENAMIICGAACLIVPLVAPRAIAAHLFALVWVGFLLLLDPINRRAWASVVSRRSFRRDFDGASVWVFWLPGSFAAGCGNSGTTGRRQNGTTRFPCFKT